MNQDEIVDWTESGDAPAAAAAGILPPAVDETPAPVVIEAAETEDEEAATEPPVTAVDRDNQGRFKGRHRAAKDRARPEDVPRIKELSAKNKAYEETHRTLAEENTRIKAELEQLRRGAAAPPAVAKPAPAPVARAASDPEPDPADTAKYPDGLFDRKFMLDQARWVAREELRQDREQTQQQATAQTKADAFRSAITQARAKYPDYDAVAFAPGEIPANFHVVDKFIKDDDETGAEILYHIRKFPDELNAILRLSELGQLKALSLLSQRLSTPPTRMQTGTTGAVAAPARTAVPRPPTPVRTGPVSAGKTIPDADSEDLMAHMRHYYPKGRRREG